MKGRSPRVGIAGVATALTVAVLVAPAFGQSASPVSVVEPQRITVEDSRRLTGSVTAERISALSPRIAGLVADIAVDAGDRVEQGAIILRLDDELARFEQARIQAAVSEGRARLEEARRLSNEAEALAAKRNLPETQAEAAKADARISTEALARLEAEAALQEATLRRHRLTAPFAGVISARYADPGEWVQATSAVVDLVALNTLRFDVRAPQELFPVLAEGETVTVFLDALPSKPLSGRVAARVPLADDATRTFLLRIGFDEPPAGVIPGMSGEARIALSSKQQAWTVPRDALVSYPDGTRSVWLVEARDGQPVAIARRVRVGRSLGADVELLEGISGGERVIVRGNEGLRDAQPVRIVGAAQD